jgi:hypothetical protein
MPFLMRPDPRPFAGNAGEDPSKGKKSRFRHALGKMIVKPRAQRLMAKLDYMTAARVRVRCSALT